MKLSFIKSCRAMVKSAVLGATLLSSSVFATEGAERLESLLQGYDSLSTKFEQVTLADNGRQAQRTSGSLILSKPNLFRWETQQPFPQEIVSDGRYIWIHDPDLEQVTQRKADSEQGSAPALILNGQIDALQKKFAITLVEDMGSEQIFDLTPLNEQSNFSRIRLAFANEMISELMLEDSLGQRTSLVFFEQQRNPELNEATFFFRVPADADLIIDIEE